MIRALSDDSYSMFGPAITEKKTVEKVEWPAREARTNEKDPLFGERTSSPIYSESGRLTHSDRLGQNLNMKI